MLPFKLVDLYVVNNFDKKITRFLLIKEKVLTGKKSTIKHRTFMYQRSLSSLK